MIVPMQKYGFIVHHAVYPSFLEDLGRLGLLHIQYRAVEPSPQLEEALAELKDIRTTLHALHHRAVTPDHQPAAGLTAEKIIYEHEQLVSALDQARQKRQILRKEIDYWRPWGDFSVETLRRLREAEVVVRFFVCPERKFEPAWSEAYSLWTIAEEPPDRHFVVVTAPYDTPDIEAEEIAPPDISLAEREEQLAAINKQIKHLRQQYDQLAIRGIPVLEAALLAGERQVKLVEVVDSTRRELEDTVMMIEGFAPAERSEEIFSFCEERGVPFLCDQPRPHDGPPVLLRNSRFARLFEPIGQLFALPAYQELDLTPYFAPFFMLFFGFCLGDAGYGLFLLLAATLYKRRAAEGLRPVLALVQWLGLATILFGALTGTVFGMNLLEDQYAFLGQARNWMLDSDQTFQLALILGLVQIFFGLLIKGMNQVRQFGWLYSLATWGWMLLLLGLLDSGLLQLTGIVATVVTWTGVALILLFNDPQATILSRLGKGIWELYGITGIFGDLLSYIRLFALGISSAILGFVINDIALQIKDSMAIIGPVLFVLFLLIGHGLNLLIASLGAFVHPMRLTFVEFYKNAGFRGGGKAYQPFILESQEKQQQPSS
jgi:V/A-type H+-transporting ATPase subunit I